MLVATLTDVVGVETVSGGSGRDTLFVGSLVDTVTDLNLVSVEYITVI